MAITNQNRILTEVVAIKPSTSATMIEEETKRILNLPMKRGDTRELLSLADVQDTNISVAQAIVIAQVRKALSGDTKAFVALLKAGLIDIANTQEPLPKIGGTQKLTILEILEQKIEEDKALAEFERAAIEYVRKGETE